MSVQTCVLGVFRILSAVSDKEVFYFLRTQLRKGELGTTSVLREDCFSSPELDNSDRSTAGLKYVGGGWIHRNLFGFSYLQFTS